MRDVVLRNAKIIVPNGIRHNILTTLSRSAKLTGISARQVLATFWGDEFILY